MAGILTNSTRGVWTFAPDFDGDTGAVSADEVKRAVRAYSARDTAPTASPPAGEPAMPPDGDDVSADEITPPPDVNLHWQARLQNILLALSPAAFEHLSLRILRESGFAQVEVTGRTGDGGIDGKGIYRFNDILSFHVVFQCKRYRGSVSASEMRDFRGAMQGRADKGLYLTTGIFTAGAQREATREGVPAIDLIDGDELIEKLCALELGVKKEIIVKYEVDEAWFAGI